MTLVATLVGIATAAAMVVGQGAVRATIERSAPAADGRVTVVVRAIAPSFRMGAYQGTLRWAPGSVEVVGSSTPSGDGTRMVNAADSTQGILRFAGFAVPGFRSDTLVAVVVRAPRGWDAAQLKVHLDVVSDADGQRLPNDSIRDSRSRP